MRRAVAVLLLALLGPGARDAGLGLDDVVVVPGTSFPAGGTYLTLVRLRRPLRRRPPPDRPASVGRRRRRAAGQPRHPAGAAGDRAAPPGRSARVDSGRRRRLVDVGPAGLGRAGRRPRLVRRLASCDEGEVWSGRADLAATAGEWQQVSPGTARFTLDPGRRRDR